MKISKIKIFAFSLFFIMFLFSVNFCYAANLQDAFNPATNKPLGAAADVGAGFNTTITYEQIVSAVISSVLSLMGVIFLILMLYAGFNWMTARGEEEKVTKAKDTLTRAIVGLIIVLAAYAISYFVLSQISGKTLKDSSLNTSNPSAGAINK